METTATAAQLRVKLRQHFGFRQFHAGQAESVRSALKGRDTLVVMPIVSLADPNREVVVPRAVPV